MYFILRKHVDSNHCKFNYVYFDSIKSTNQEVDEYLSCFIIDDLYCVVYVNDIDIDEPIYLNAFDFYGDLYIHDLSDLATNKLHVAMTWTSYKVISFYGEITDSETEDSY